MPQFISSPALYQVLLIATSELLSQATLLTFIPGLGPTLPIPLFKDLDYEYRNLKIYLKLNLQALSF